MPITPQPFPVESHETARHPPAELYREAHRLSRREFAARHNVFFLVPEVACALPATEEDDAPPSVEDWDLPTGVTALDEVRRFQEFGRQLFAVRKVQALYPDMITVGRTANHDIPLRDPSVSKFQAHFKLQPSGVYLVDAGSTNGTAVDGTKLWPRSQVLVVAGSVISFGGLRLRFLSADAAWSAVHQSA